MSVLPACCSFIQAMSTYLENILDQALQRVWEAEKIASKSNTLAGSIVQGDAYLLGAIVCFALSAMLQYGICSDHELFDEMKMSWWQIQITQGSYVKGAWNLKSSWGYYKSAAATLSSGKYTGSDRAELECAVKFGTGFFNLLVSMLPPTIITVASWIGFSGDRERGLNELRDAVQSDKTMAPFSALLLLSYLCGIAAQIGYVHVGTVVDDDHYACRGCLCQHHAFHFGIHSFISRFCL
jgi:hypothetical protein